MADISSYPNIASNITSISQCTPSLCSLEYAVVKYIPSSAANGAFAAIFAACFLIQLIFWVQYRTHSFSISVCCGLILEVLGYGARVVMKNQLFVQGPFLMQIITLTVAPVFFTAALYLTLSRIIMHYGPHYSRLTPKAYTITFICSDIIALIAQSIGGALADTAGSLDSAKTGTNIMVGGLSFQVLSLIAFVFLASQYFWKVRKGQKHGGAMNYAAESSKRPSTSAKGFKIFIAAFAHATLLILVRSCFRVAELAHGFRSKLANDQVAFMVLEGGMILLAVLLLTSFPPGKYFGQDKWKESGWGVGKSGSAATGALKAGEPKVDGRY